MELKAKKREITGKKVKSLRKQAKLPAVLFGAGKESAPLTLDLHEFEKIYKEAGESTILDLDVEGKKEKILISELQHDPMGKIIHADFQRIEAGEELTATVAIETVGESPAVKESKGILLTLLDEVEVECLPQDLPSEIKVDISGLKEVDDTITIKDLPVDFAKVKIPDHKPDEPVLKIDYVEMQEVKEEAVSEEEAVAAVAAEKEKAPGEGEGEEGKEGDKQEAKEEEKTEAGGRKQEAGEKGKGD